MGETVQSGRRDSPGTRDALIEAGRQLFAERGFEGASVRAITNAAGANLGAITYHFGTKEAFYDEVIAATVEPMVNVLLAAARAQTAPLARAESVVRAYFEYMSAHAEIPRLILQGVVASGMPPQSAMRFLHNVMTELVTIVREGQRDGTIRDGDAVVMGMGIISQALHLLIMRKALAAVVGIDLSDAKARARLTEELVRFVRAGLCANGEESRP